MTAQGLSTLCYPFRLDEVITAATQQRDGYQGLMAELSTTLPDASPSHPGIDEAQVKRNHFDALLVGLRRLSASGIKTILLSLEDIELLGITA